VCHWTTDTGSIEQEQLANEDSSTSTYSSSEPAAKKKRVKRVSWVDESKLCSYFYFQMDESERGQSYTVNSGPVWAQQHCSPSCFLADCCKRRLKPGSFVLLYFALFVFWVVLCFCIVRIFNLSSGLYFPV